jgi:hypothetical protein
MASSTPTRRRAAAHAPDPPTPQQLLAAPELAVLDALQHLIELTGRALVAAHPELIGERSLRHLLDPQATLADRLIRHMALLANATTRYQVAACAALHESDSDPGHDDDFPF